jgi:hypothetical protein
VITASRLDEQVGQRTGQRLVGRLGEGGEQPGIEGLQRQVGSRRISPRFSERLGNHLVQKRQSVSKLGRSAELAGQAVADDHTGGLSWQPIALGEPGIGQRLVSDRKREPVGEVG